MSDYEMGRDIGELMCRMQALEDRVATLEHSADDCGCGAAEAEGERTARALTEEEMREDDARGEKQQVVYCEYVVTGFFGNRCPGIRINDSLCISPCPSCPNVRRINLLNANGTPMCSVQVIRGSGTPCTQCPPGGHKFVWV